MGLGLEINIYHIFVEILCNCITHVTIIKKKSPYLLTYLLTYFAPPRTSLCMIPSVAAPHGWLSG